MKKLAIIFIFLSSCASTDNTTIKFDREVQTFTHNDFEEEVVKSEIKYFSEIIKPNHITVTKSNIIVSDRATKRHLHIISKENSNYLGQVGERGQGPNEFLSFSGFKRNFIDHQFIVYSMNDKKVVFFTIPQELENTGTLDIQPDSIINLNEVDSEITYFEFLSDKSLVSKQLTKKEKFVHIDFRSGERVKSWDTWDGMLDQGDIPLSISASVFQGSLVSSPDRKHFGHATVFWDLIEVFNRETDKWLRLVGPDQLEHKFSIDNSPGYPMHYIEEGNKIGYVDFYLGSEYIFGLYSGMPDRVAHGTKVLIFDYDGNPVKSYKLDVPAIRFAVDENENTIYLIFTEKDEAAIAKFKFK